MDKSKKLLNIVLAGMAAAVVFLMTYFLKMPAILGYIHLGDIAIVIFSLFLTPTSSFAAAAIGSSMADILSPAYIIYAPFTFVIKGLNALVVSLLSRKINNELSALIGGFVMVCGYFISEILILPIFNKDFGWAVGLAGLSYNLMQAASGVVVGCLVARALQKAGIKRF